MNKSDLKDGMIVEYKDGNFGLKLGARIISQNECLELEDLEENLTTTNEQDVIVRIYESVNVNFFSEINNKNKLKLIWERPREINWSKVPRGINVRVRNSKDVMWQDTKFIYINSYEQYKFYTNSDNDYGVNCWKYCEIIDEIKEEWYK